MSEHTIKAFIGDDIEVTTSFCFTPYEPACLEPGLIQPEQPPEVDIYEILLGEHDFSELLGCHVVECIRKQCFKYMEKLNELGVDHD